MTATRQLGQGPRARDLRVGGELGEPEDLRGPKRMVLAVLLFFTGSVIAVHFLDPIEGPQGAAAAAAVATAGRGARASVEDRGGARPPEAAPAPAPVPAVLPPVERPADPERARALDECVERAVRAAGDAQVEPTAPGRWPALKRARERLRQRRLAATADCARELAL